MSYITRFSQNVIPDTNNNTVANLAGGASFIGVASDTLTYVGYQFTFKADQNCSIIIEQSPGIQTGLGTVTTTNPGGVGTITGSGGTKFLTNFVIGDQIFIAGEATHIIASVVSDTVMTTTTTFTTVVGASYTQYHWDVVDTYLFNVVQDNFGLTTQLVGSYVRTKVTNLSSVTTTFLRLDCVLVPIVEAVPRSLDSHGHLKTAIYEMEAGGFELRSGPMGTLDVDQPYRLCGTAFSGTSIDSNFWTATQNGTGATTSAATPGIIIMTSGTSSGGYSNFVTVRPGRFIFAHPHKFRSIVRLTAAIVTNSTRRWGAFTAAGGPPVVPVDGFWFEQTGAGVLTINCRNNSGTITTISSGAFNGEVSDYVIDTNAHAYEIIFFLGSATYFVDGTKLHTFYPTTTMLSSTFTLPVQYQTTSSAISSSAVMEVWAGMILRLGRENSTPRSVYQPAAVTAQVLKIGPGTLRGIVNGDNVGSVIFYDALSATNIISSIDLTRAIGSISINIDFYTGLTYTTTGTPKLTITYE